jgi:ribonuclease P protein subunit RPR2
MHSSTVSVVTRVLARSDASTLAHSRRVRLYATVLSSALRRDLLDESGARLGFLLHDVGKLGIPPRILGKPGALTATERLLIERHPVLGERMLRRAGLARAVTLEVVRSHHERWDGSGYPDGLAGTEIPLGARVFAVADALDAITSDRPYRQARSWSAAVREIVRQSGRQFDPEVVCAFCEHQQPLRALGRELRAA